MSEKFAKAVVCFSLAVAVILGIVLTVVGGIMEGWSGVAVMLGGMAVFVILLYLYNRKYR